MHEEKKERMTLEEYRKRNKGASGPRAIPRLRDNPPASERRVAPAKVRQRHMPGKMNKTEQRFAEYLNENNLVASWSFERQTFVVAPRTRYTPDFRLEMADGTIRQVDVKGAKNVKENGKVVGTRPLWEETTWAKAKAAAEQFPEYGFYSAHYDRKLEMWVFNEIPHV